MNLTFIEFHKVFLLNCSILPIFSFLLKSIDITVAGRYNFIVSTAKNVHSVNNYALQNIVLYYKIAFCIAELN